MTTWLKINGTTTDALNLGFQGPKLKDDAGNLAVKTSDDSAHGAVTAANVIVANDTTGFKVDIAASPDQLADYVFTLPPTEGVSGQFLQTAGNGSYTWETAVQPGQMTTETLIGIAGQTGFTLANSPTGDVAFAINGAVIATAAATVAGTLVTYAPSENFGYIIEDSDQITVTYLFGTVAAGDLNSLADVDVISPVNGSALIYNAATQKWVVGAGIVDPTSLTNGSSNVSMPVASGNVNISVSGVANILTITPAGGNVIGNLDVSDTFTAINANISGNIFAGNITVPALGEIDTWDLRVANDAIVTGNLNVLGNLNTTDTNAFTISGPIFEFGGQDNGDPLVINDGMDRGALLNYYDGAPLQSFMGWKNADSEFVFGAKVSNTNNVITVAELGNLRGDTYYGNVIGGNIQGNFIGNVTGNLVNGTSNVVIGAPGGDVTFAVNGVGDAFVVSEGGVSTAGNLDVALHAAIAGNITVAGHSLLGDVSRVHVDGGVDGQVIITDGLGNLSWANLSTKEVVNGNSNVIVNANGSVNISSNGVANVFIVTESAANVKGNLTVTGTTRLNVIGNVKINGGANGQVVVTDGAGNLSFAVPIIANLNNGTSNVRVFADSNVTTSVNGVANIFTVTQTGANVVGVLTSGNVATGNLSVVANAVVGGNLSVSTNAVVAGTLKVEDTLEVTNDASMLSNLAVTSNLTVGANATVAGDLRVTADAHFSAVGNVFIPGGTTGQLLKTDGAGNLSWTTVNTALKIQDEGVEIAATANTINFVGAEITSSAVGNLVTVNVTPGNIANINNGTSNVMIGAADDVVVTSVGGVANVWTVTSEGGDLIGNLSVTGVTTLSEPGNLKITGGDAGQVLTTDGTGNLTWAAAGGAITIRDEGTELTSAATILNFTGAGVAAGILSGVVTINVPGAGSSQPTIEFVAPIDGVDQAFDDPAIFNLVSNTQCQIYVNGVLARSTDFTVAGTTLTFTRHLTTGDEITAAPVTVLTSVPQGAIASGSSGVVVSANANVGVSVAGVADVAVFSELGADITGDLTVTGNVSVGTDLSVTGNATFGDVSNVSIGGGTSGQVLSTDGAGVLSWVTQTGGGGGGATVVPVPTIEFVATADGAGQVFTDANIALILSNAQCSTYVNGSLATVADFSVSGSDITFDRWINTGDVISVAAFGVTNMSVTGAGGATTQLQFNQAGNLRGIASATYDGTKLTLGSNAQVKITGGTAGQALVTDGTGNLSWTTAAAIAGGIDTELQYNNGGTITGIPTATYDGAVLSLGEVDEVSILGGTAGQSLTTNGAGVLSWSPAIIGSWTNAGPMVIGATTTAPTKGTPLNDFVRYRKIADREYQVQMMYNQTTAGSAGSGDYLFTLPAGLEFDFTAPGQRMTPGAMSNTVGPVAVTLGLPGGSAGIVNGSGGAATWVAQSIIIPYSATQFRLFSASALSTVGTVTTIASNSFNLSDAATGYNLNFSFIATV